MFSKPTVWEDCHIETYHADRDSISSSSKEKYVTNPELYAAFIRGEIADEETPALRTGRLLHTAMEGGRLEFEPERFGSLKDDWKRLAPGTAIAYPDFCFKKGTDHLMPNTNKARQDWEAANSGYTFLKRADLRALEDWWDWRDNLGDATICKNEMEYTSIRAMADRLRTHPKVKTLLEFDGDAEFTLRFVHTETGLPCRARFDWFAPPWIVDWKTTTSVADRSFARIAWQKGYHRQAAWYLDAAAAYLEAHFDPAELTFVFAAVETSFPYTPKMFTLGGIDMGETSPITEWIELGRKQNAAILRAIADGRANGGEYKSDRWDMIVDLPAPRFAKFDDSFELPLE